MFKRTGKKDKKRGFYIQEEISLEIEPSQSSDEDKDYESPKEFMLMAIENLQVEAINFEDEEG